jgi:UDP-3-O-acyl-N-acetylglucosamine deacetylase
MTQQQTLNSQISFFGRGLHTGADINLTICPAEANTGIVFQRIDIEGEPVIAALAENVSGTVRGTVLKSGNAEVSTVEHCLSALYAMGIDNAI